MRHLILKLVNAAMGRGFSSVAVCAICSRDYRDAKPFVEGVDGTLVCRDCVKALVDVATLRASIVADDASTDQLPSHASDLDPNPYSPPSSSNNDKRCVFCGESIRCGDAVTVNERLLFCTSCVFTSVELVEGKTF